MSPLSCSFRPCFALPIVPVCFCGIGWFDTVVAAVAWCDGEWCVCVCQGRERERERERNLCVCALFARLFLFVTQTECVSNVVFRWLDGKSISVDLGHFVDHGVDTIECDVFDVRQQLAVTGGRMCWC